MQYTLQEFIRQTENITKAFAFAASVPASQVSMSATERFARRILLIASVDVEVVIQAESMESASNMTKLLTNDSLNDAMATQGLKNLVVTRPGVVEVIVVTLEETPIPIGGTMPLKQCFVFLFFVVFSVILLNINV